MWRNREALIFKHSTCRFIADSRGTELKLTSKKERREMGGWGGGGTVNRWATFLI